MDIRKPKIIVSNRVYIPKAELNFASVKKEYTTNLYNEAACKVCEFKPDRHSYLCDVCPAFLEQVVLYQPKILKGIKYIGLPVGDKDNIERKAKILFSDFKIIDRRTLAPFKYKIKFLAKLRPVQEQLVKDFMKKKYGLLIAPPRTGKTVCMLKICLELGQRTLVMASQYEFLTQFIDHLHGNEKESIPKCTNLPELETKYGKKLYGFPKTDEDFENFQFLFMTYQSFISEKNGKNRLLKIRNNVGTLAIDEVHKSNAKCFASTVSSIRTRYKIGCTGTRERKDCFVGETLVHLTETTSTTIKNIVQGSIQEVLSKNIDSGKLEIKPILEKHKVIVNKLFKITIGSSIFLCTEDHEWWSVTRNMYVKTKELKIGEELQELRDVYNEKSKFY